MRIVQFDGVTVVKQADDEDSAAFYGPDREANARKFQHMDELVEAVEGLGVLPDGYCFCGRTNAGPHDPECRDVRDILAKIKGGAK